MGSNIEKNKTDAQIIPSYASLQNKIYNILYRYSGHYEPIFKNVNLFQKGLTYSYNSIFDTELTDFGIIKNLIISKINRNGNVLKLKNSTNLSSIYPMLDEFGYTIANMFIFKSNWDYEYYTECSPTPITPIINVATINHPINFTPVSITPEILS